MGKEGGIGLKNVGGGWLESHDDPVHMDGSRNVGCGPGSAVVLVIRQVRIRKCEDRILFQERV